MNLRLLIPAWLCILALGCGDGGNVEEKPVPDSTAESAAPMEAYRFNAAFDPDGRIFLFWGATPSMVTSIHSQFVEEFIQRPGMGFGRMAPPPRAPHAWVELYPESEGERHYQSSPGAKAGVQPQYDTIRETLTLPDGTKRIVRERVWLLGVPELMSVNAETGPAVYDQRAQPTANGTTPAPVLNPFNIQSDHDLMKQKKASDGKSAPKRKLDEFETAALPKLREGNDVAMQSSAKELRVLGAIRARQECIACHKEATVGTMLGAFSYKLPLQSEATRPEDCLKDTTGLSQATIGAVRVVESLGGKVVCTSGGPVSEIDFTYTIKAGTPQPALFFNTTHVRLKNSSLRILEAFPELAVLDISNSMVTDAGLKEIAKNKQLKKVNVNNTYVTNAGVAELKVALPGCDIVFNPALPGLVAP